MIRYPHTIFHYVAGDDEPGTSVRALCVVAGSRIGRGRPPEARRKWFQTTRDREAVSCRRCRRRLAMGDGR